MNFGCRRFPAHAFAFTSLLALTTSAQEVDTEAVPAGDEGVAPASSEPPAPLSESQPLPPSSAATPTPLAPVSLSAESMVSAESAAFPETPPELVETAPAEEEEGGPSVQFGMFADTYVSYNSAATGSPVPFHRAFDNNTPFDPVTGFPTDAAGDPAPLGSRNGFGLSFVGLDASYDTGVVAITSALRFGPSVPIYYGTDTGAAGIDSFLSGYVTVRPTEALSLDAGYFGTIYGAEVAESWLNANYTRGGLYYAMQPFYHFGVKGSLAVSEVLTLRGMVVNGANNIADENDAPAFGLQLAFAGVGGVLDLLVGGFYETGDDSSWGIETFLDVVAILNLGDFRFIGNYDYNINRGADGAEDTRYYGVSGTLGYAFTPQVGVALRGEYLRDINSDIWTVDAGKVSVSTATATLDLKLVEHLYLRPEFRYETSSEDIFFDRDSASTDSWYTALLGIVGTTSD